jgi:OMF family outer membrane factor
MKAFSIIAVALGAVLGGTAAAQPQPAQPVPPTAQPAPGQPTTATPTPAAPGAQDPNAPTTSAGVETLSLERAIEIAMRQQPDLRIAKAQLEAANGRTDLARVARNPTISLQGTLSANNDRATVATVNGVPTGGGGNDFLTATAGTSLSASASWRIYDFGQTSLAIKAAALNAEATAAGVVTSTLDIRTNVETAYLEAVARRRLVQVAEATVKSEDAHLDQARRFVAAQAKDPIEVAQAQARDANAKSALALAQSNEAIALANLRSAIGWVEANNSPIVSSAFPTPSEADPPSLAALVDTARKRRPEIVQFDKQIAASDADVAAAHAERRPVLSAGASVVWLPGEGDWSPEPGWQASLTLGWQLFDGGRSSADVRIARAGMQVAIAQRDQLLVNLTSQLDSSRSQIIADRANVQASTEAVTAARAQLQLADARYAQGLGSQIELADAQTAVTTAEGNLVTAEFQLATAWAQLRRNTAE